MNKKTVWTIVIIIVLILIIWLIAANGNNNDAEVEGASLEVADQVEGDDILVSQATLAKPGYVVVLNQDGEVVGTSDYREAGTYEDLQITLISPSAEGDSYEVTIFEDDGSQTFEVETDTRVSLTGRALAGGIVIVSESEAGADGLVGTDDDPAADDDDSMSEEDTDTATTTDEGDDEDDTDADTEATATIRYTDSGFVPSELLVARGTTVRFVNESSGSMWVASNVHPTHEILPAFDQLTAVTTGGDYEFTFDQEGTWEFHNHVSANHTGTVEVQ